MIQYNQLKHIVLMTGIALILFGCARGEEFAIVENEQTTQNRQFPEFRQPTAAVNQFTEEDKERLTKRLDADKRMVTNSSISGSNSNVRNANRTVSNTQTRDDIRRETEDILRQIEQSGAPE